MTSNVMRLTIILESAMRWNRIEGNWSELKGKAKQNWGKLTDDHIEHVDGKREHLVGKIQEVYGIDKDEAERQINEFTNSMHDAINRGAFKS